MDAASLTISLFPSHCHLLQRSRMIRFTHNSLRKSRSLNFFISRPKKATLRTSEISACSSAENAENCSMEIDMVRSNKGTYTPEHKHIMVLWDLDNKPPRLPPYESATALRNLALIFGDVMDISAYSSSSAAANLSDLVINEDGHRWRREILEKKGLVTLFGPFFCKLCGRRSRSYSDLQIHFRDMHEKEHKRIMGRISVCRGKRKLRYEMGYAPKQRRYEMAAKAMFEPKEGDEFVSELRRAGVLVRAVKDKKEAVYKVLKRQLEEFSDVVVDWILVVSDDLDFTEMLVGARKSKLGTVVVGDNPNSLSHHADYWAPWDDAENGNVTGKDFKPISDKSGDLSGVDDDYKTVSVNGVYDGDDVNGSNISHEERS